MISKTYNRYLWLLNTLLQYKKLSLKQLQRKWENSSVNDGSDLSRRTFFEHKNAVEEMFQVNIECDSSDGYKYYISDESEFRQDNARKWLLNTFNVSSMVGEAKDMHKRILLEDIPEGTEYLQLIIDAMRRNHILEVEYKPFYGKEKEVYNIHPYCLRVYRQRWYILGWYEERNAVQHCALDRVWSITELEDKFKFPKDFSADKYYQDHIGIWVNEKDVPEKVVIRAFGQQADYLRTLPLHHSQKKIGSGDGYTDYQYKLCNTRELVRELLAKGSMIEVLEPQSLRNDVIKEAKFLLGRYKRERK